MRLRLDLCPCKISSTIPPFLVLTLAAFVLMPLIIFLLPVVMRVAATVHKFAQLLNLFLARMQAESVHPVTKLAFAHLLVFPMVMSVVMVVMMMGSKLVVYRLDSRWSLECSSVGRCGKDHVWLASAHITITGMAQSSDTEQRDQQ